jgi:hypothetical protein
MIAKADGICSSSRYKNGISFHSSSALRIALETQKRTVVFHEPSTPVIVELTTTLSHYPVGSRKCAGKCEI